MAKESKKKQTAVPYEFIQEVNKMSKDQIVRRFIQEEDDLSAMQDVGMGKMDFKFTEQQEILRKSVYDFVEKECPREYVRKLDENKEYPYEVYDKMVQYGSQNG